MRDLQNSKLPELESSLALFFKLSGWVGGMQRVTALISSCFARGSASQVAAHWC